MDAVPQGYECGGHNAASGRSTEHKTKVETTKSATPSATSISSAVPPTISMAVVLFWFGHAGAEPDEDQIPSVGCNIKWKPGNAPPWFG